MTPEPTGSPRTVVVAAIPEEISPLLGRLNGRSVMRLPLLEGRARGSADVTLGDLAGQPVAVLVTGDGARRARAGTAAILRALPVRRMLVIGLGGGLSPELAPGDLILARAVVAEDGARFEAPEATEAAAEAAGARLGTVLTVDRLVLGAEEKRHLREEAVPSSEACLLDLESFHCAAAAQEAGVPWAVIRAVNDTASEDLPEYLYDCAGPGGEIRRAAVLRHAARHPSVVPELFRMRSRVDLCAEALAGAVVGYVKAGLGAPAAAVTG